MSTDSRIVVRPAVPEDVPQIMSFIRELAGYERVPEEVIATEEMIRRAIFEEEQTEALIAEYEGDYAGFALFFQTFSSWRGRAGLYLDDLYVRPEYRSLGIGRAMFLKLASLAVERGYGRFEWACPEWSAPSIAFYRSLGAVPLNGWTAFRLEGDQIRAAATCDGKA